MTLTRAINSASRMAGGTRLCTHKRTRVVRKRAQMTVRPDIWKKGRSAPDTTGLIYMASVGIEPIGVTATAQREFRIQVPSIHWIQTGPTSDDCHRNRTILTRIELFIHGQNGF